MISQRAQSVDASGIRKIFDLAAKLKAPVNLSMGQPDFDAFDSVKQAAKEAIDSGKSKYGVTHGIPELRQKVRDKHGISADDKNFDAIITSGVTGGNFLAYMVLCDPGDQVLIPDPFFVVYRDIALMLNIEPTYYDSYPDFKLDAGKIEKALTPRTKAIFVNSPGNPTGYACTQEELNQVVEVARKHDVYLIFDEIYDYFCFDRPHVECFGSYEKVILLNGYSKSAGVPGWRLGYAVGPSDVIAQMAKLQQMSYVCANTIGQWAMIPAMEEDFSALRQEYMEKRDFICDALSAKYNFVRPGGAFYVFPEAPGGDGMAFVENCVENNLLVVPGSAFSRRNTHFRISYSAPLEVLKQGAEILNRLA